MSVIIAFDPGKSGAMAVYAPADRNRVTVYDLPVIGKHLNGVELVGEIERAQPTFAVIEQVSAMPGNGAVSMFNFGRNYGGLLGIVQALRIPHALVTPGKWKRVMGLSSDKSLSRQRATELFPHSAAMFRRVKDDGRAEACLMALYAADNLLPNVRVAA